MKVENKVVMELDEYVDIVTKNKVLKDKKESFEKEIDMLVRCIIDLHDYDYLSAYLTIKKFEGEYGNENE